MAQTEHVQEGVGEDIPMRVAGVALDDEDVVLRHFTEHQTAAAGAQCRPRMSVRIWYTTSSKTGSPNGGVFQPFSGIEPLGTFTSQ